MSKFCRVISAKTEAAVEEYPLQFLYLDIIADWLINETLQLDEEFVNKRCFMQKQQEQILANEQNFIEMHEKLQMLNNNVIKLELDVNECNDSIIQLQQAIKKLDQLPCNCCNPGNRKQNSNNYDDMLELLEKTDMSLMFLSSLMQDISEYELCLHCQVNPYNIISSILDCHNNTLLQTEKNIDIALERTWLVDKANEQLLDKISKSKQGLLEATDVEAAAQ